MSELIRALTCRAEPASTGAAAWASAQRGDGEEATETVHVVARALLSEVVFPVGGYAYRCEDLRPVNLRA